MIKASNISKYINDLKETSKNVEFVSCMSDDIRFITKNSQYENWELYYYQKDGGYIIFIFDKNLINETITPKMVANESVGYCEFNINNIKNPNQAFA